MARQPRFSLIIPTCDRPEALRHCLEALGMFQDCELIIADDSRSTAMGREIAREFPSARWIQGPRRGPAANRNAGARAAQGAWIVFLDDDCEPVPGWQQALMQAMEDDRLDVIEGKTICPGKRDTLFQEQVENLEGDLFWSCNLAIRRDVFLELGGFDEDFTEAGGEDLELAWRIRRKGLVRRFVPEALVRHPPRQLTWRRLWWRTLFIRWHLLYRLKTGGSPSLRSSAARACLMLIGRQFADLLRSTAHVALRFDRTRWRRILAEQAWRWLTFPVLLPYLIGWEVRFRRRLKAGDQSCIWSGMTKCRTDPQR